jgi:HlyD family secretion protein
VKTPPALKTLVLVLLASVGASVGTVVLWQRFGSSRGLDPLPTPGERLSALDSFGHSPPAEGREMIAALGRVEPRDGLIEVSGGMGHRVDRLLVGEGDWVEDGAPLVYLDSHDEVQAELASVQAQLDEAQGRLAAETAYANAQIRQAEVGLEEADRLGPHQVALQTAQVRLATLNLQTAQDDLRRMREVRAPGVLSEQQREHQQALVGQAEAKLESAQAALAQAEESLKLNQSKAQAQLNAAQAQLRQIQSSVPVKSLTKQLAAVEARLRRAVIGAPCAGRILSIRTRPGEQTGQQPVLVMADTRAMSVIAEVYETDVQWVRVGQRATITSPALPRPLTGVVVRVGQLVYQNNVLHVDPAAIQDARVVETEIRLDKPDVARDLIHLQVDVRIDVAGDVSGNAAEDVADARPASPSP